MRKQNERKMEDIVDALLRDFRYYDKNGSVSVEKQSSDSPRIQKLLQHASKIGNGAGHPEFIIHSDKYPDFLVVIECKAKIKHHDSRTPLHDKYKDFAVDGVLLYAAHLSKEFDVMAVAISGETQAELQVSHFLHLKAAAKAVEYNNVRNIVSFEEYYQGFMESGVKFNQDYDALLDYGKNLNNQLQERKIQAVDRGFLISGIMIGLKNKTFRDSYQSYKTGKQIANHLLGTIDGEFEDAKIPPEKPIVSTQVFFPCVDCRQWLEFMVCTRSEFWRQASRPALF